MGKSEAQKQREREAAAAGEQQQENPPEGGAPGTLDVTTPREDEQPPGSSTAPALQEGSVLDELAVGSDAAGLAGAHAPVRTVDEAREAVRRHQPGAVPVVELGARDRASLPAQFPSSGTAGGPTHAPVGTPTAQLRTDLQRLGDGTARGETQPGIPPPGDAERFVHPETLEGAQERVAGEGRATSAAHENGVITVRRDDGKVLRINLTHVEGIEDEDGPGGGHVKITLASGKAYDFDGEDAGVVRSALPR